MHTIALNSSSRYEPRLLRAPSVHLPTPVPLFLACQNSPRRAHAAEFLTRAVLADSQQEALLKFRDGLQPREGAASALSDWSRCTDPCSPQAIWRQLSCSAAGGAGVVTGMNLMSLGLTGTLPSSVSTHPLPHPCLVVAANALFLAWIWRVPQLHSMLVCCPMSKRAVRRLCMLKC